MKKKRCGALGAGLALGMLWVPLCGFAEEDTITVTISAYDYNAADGGIAAASPDGVILDRYSVKVPVGSTDVEAIKKAFADNDISVTLSENYYGGYYISEINGLREYSNTEAEPDYSGWMLEYNDDHFTNYGLGTLGTNGDGVLSDGDLIEFHYSLDGGTDLGSVYSGNPVLSSLTVGEETVQLAKMISYDESWNPIYTFTADGEIMEGDGSQENPFALHFDWGEVENSETAVSYSASHYFAVDGIADTHDFSEPLRFAVSTESGLTSYFTVSAEFQIKNDSEAGDDPAHTDEEQEPNQSVTAGDISSAVLLFTAAAAGAAAALTSPRRQRA